MDILIPIEADKKIQLYEFHDDRATFEAHPYMQYFQDLEKKSIGFAKPKTVHDLAFVCECSNSNMLAGGKQS